MKGESQRRIRPRALVHNRDREAEILTAARAVFEQFGFEAASVAEIARRAHVAEGTIYLYCVSKRDLLQQVVARWYEQLISDAAPGLASLQDSRAKLRFFAHQHLVALGDNAAIGRLLVAELRSVSDYPGSTLHKLNARYARRLTDILRAGAEAGELRRDLRIDIARDAFFGALEHMAIGGLAAGNHREHAVDAFVSMYWRSIESA